PVRSAQAVPAELGVRAGRARERPAEAGGVRRAVLGGAAERLERPAGDHVPEVPDAELAAADAAGGRDREERVELGAGRRRRAADAGRRVAEDLRGADVRLELDGRVPGAARERPEVLEGGRVVRRAVRPVRLVRRAVEVEA